MPMVNPHSVREVFSSKIRRLSCNFLLMLVRMGEAIALGEAGDLEGADALRKRKERAHSSRR